MTRDYTLPISRNIAVIGLGYVGLPVAVAFALKQQNVIGYDISARRIDELRDNFDRTGEVEQSELKAAELQLTSDPADLKAADFFIVTVPTPIDDARRPDLGPLLWASDTVAQVLKPGDIVVYESTVYPGATEEDCLPVLEAGSGLKAGMDFTVAYSPERINPGDKEHRLDTITKIVSGQTPETLEIVADLYGQVVTAGIHRAPDIRTAETAKVIENAQRDLNIAFVNELSAICHILGIDTIDVLEAASTKWNFLNFRPGLVGGHCIGVDPYYLTHRAEKAGYHSQVVLAGRRVNDEVGKRVAQACLKQLLKLDRPSRRVTVLGLTFKENVPDIRNTGVINIIRELVSFGISVQVHDPLADQQECSDEYRLKPLPVDRLVPGDAAILAVPHQEYLNWGWEFIQGLLLDGRGPVFDVKAKLDRKNCPEDITLWRL